MKIFVTGGAGFLGRHFVEFLVLHGHKVTIFDNLSNSSKDLIKNIIDKGAKFVNGDITNSNELTKILNDFEIVIHLAAKISVEDSIINPAETQRINVEGTKNLLNICREKNIENFVAASSAAVYGDVDSPEIILTEQFPTNPVSPYGKSKVDMEKEIIKFSNNFGLNAIILRFFNIYGLGQSKEYAGVISKFAENIRKNESLAIFGDGNQTRDFVSIEDVISSVLLSIEHISNKHGNVYNIASGKSITINELAKLMVSASGKKLGIEYGKPKKGDIRFSHTSINLAKNELGYQPKIPISLGIKDLLHKMDIIN
jgi:UDP-glucose 4-epimerase